MAIAALAVLTCVSWTVSPAMADSPSSATDYDNWTAVASSIADELDAGVTAYDAQERATAAATFNRALNTGYVASNLAKVVNETQSAKQYDEQLAQLQQLVRLAYASGNSAEIRRLAQQAKASINASAAQCDADTTLADPRDYAAARAAQTARERERLDAHKQRVNTGRGARSWSQVADEMAHILQKANTTARAGDGEAGAAGVNDAYYQYYEKLGFEKNVMNTIGGSRVSKVEATFKEARKAMIAGQDATAYVAELTAMLEEDAATLDGGAGSQGNGNGVIGLVTSAAGQSFLVLIREGLEALLVVAAVVAYLMRTGLRRYVRWVYAGAVVGLAASGVIAVIFTAMFGGSGPQQETMEGICALVAVVMLIWSGNWMFSKRSADSWNRYIRAKTESAVSSARESEVQAKRAVASLSLLSFLAVFREGAETVIFYESIHSMTEDSLGMWIGGGLAALLLAIIFVVIRMSSARIPIGPFFTVTSILMSVLAVIFAGGGVHALIEGDVISGRYLQDAPTNDWLGIYPYVQTLVAQAVTAVIVIGMFIAGWVLQHKNNTTNNPRGEEQ